MVNLRPLFEHTSAKQVVFKNTFWLTLANLIARAFKFFLVIFAGRILGPVGYGTFTYAFSLVGLFFMFSDLGLSVLFVREYQKSDFKRDRLISITFSLKLVLVVIAALIGLGFYQFTQDPLVRSVYPILLLLYAITGLKDFLTTLARAEQRMEYEGAAALLEAAGVTVLGIVALTRAPSLPALAFAYLVGVILYTIYLTAVTARLLPPFRVCTLAEAKQLLTLSYPFAFGVVIGLLLATDVFLIKWLKDAELVGQYAVGSRIVQFLSGILSAFLAAFYPVLSGLTEERPRAAAIVRRSISVALMLAIPIVIGGFLLSQRLITGLFSDRYQPGVASFQVLILLVPLSYATSILDTLLFAFNEQVRNMKITAIAATINAILSIFFIMRFSIIGAAVAIVIAQLVNFLLTYRLSRQVLGESLFELVPFRAYLIASLVMALLVAVLNPLTVSTAIIVLLGAVSYFIVLVVLRESTLRSFLPVRPPLVPNQP